MSAPMIPRGGWSLWFVVLAGWCLSPSWIAAAPKDASQPQRAADVHVERALRAEVEGRVAERADGLRAAMEEAPDHEPARWHSGFIRAAGKWIRYDEFAAQSGDTPALAAYRNQREQAPQTVEGQLRLADWCRDQRLGQQERAHLTAVLDLAPNHAAARQRLGYVQVEGVWLSRAEIEAASQRARDMIAALQRWTPKLREIGAALAKSKPRRDYAAKQLLEIQDPLAIPAMELVLSTPAEDGALCVVEALARMKAPEASLSLTRHALFCPWERARDAAVNKLKDRDEHSFIPYTSFHSVHALAGQGGNRHPTARPPAVSAHVLLRRGGTTLPGRLGPGVFRHRGSASGFGLSVG